MDMNRVNKLGGMPSGFPFVMVLIGAAALATGAIFGTIREWFFTAFSSGLIGLGGSLVTAGAFLQAVRWVCEAFGRVVPGEPPA